MFQKQRSIYKPGRCVLNALVGIILGCVLAVPGVLADKVNITNFPADAGIDGVTVSSDGATLVIIGNLEKASTTDHVYTLPISGGMATRISPLEDDDVDTFTAVTPDGSTVVYRAEGNNDINDWYTVPIAGGASTQITFTDENVFSPLISPDGNTLFFIRDDGDGAPDDDLLFSVPITGGALTQIIPLADSDIDTLGYDLLPGGGEVVYAGSAGGSDEQTLFRVSTAGGGASSTIPIDGFQAFTDIDEVLVTPDGNNVLFIADFETDGMDELYRLPITGGAPVKISDPLTEGGDVAGMQITPDGSTVVYSADQDTDNDRELYAVSINGGGSFKISDPLVDGGDVDTNDWDIAPDGVHVFYVADGMTDGVNELFITAIPEPSGAALAIFFLCLLFTRRSVHATA